MHRRFLELLPRATGESKPVIAVNLDVRGFSRFSAEVESVEAAMYIRKVYERVLSDYYSDSTFFKPTGDGLLLVFELDENDSDALRVRANLVIETAFRLIDDFATLLDGDDWIYFAVPQHLGIGIARGAASRLVADDEDTTLDYAGTVLNTASRLMDLARPRGLVVYKTFPYALLQDAFQEKLVQDDAVYVRSVAEKLPTTIFYSHGQVEISAANRRPLDEVTWKEVKREVTVRELARFERFLIDLPERPVDPSKIVVRVPFPETTSSGTKTGLMKELTLPKSEFYYDAEAGENRVSVAYSEIARRLTAARVKPGWSVKLIIRFPA